MWPRSVLSGGAEVCDNAQQGSRQPCCDQASAQQHAGLTWARAVRASASSASRRSSAEIDWDLCSFSSSSTRACSQAETSYEAYNGAVKTVPSWMRLSESLHALELKCCCLDMLGPELQRCFRPGARITSAKS